MTTYDDSFDTASINLAQTGSVTIVPAPAFDFMISDIAIRPTSSSNVTGGAIISIGTNSPLYNDILPLTTLSGLTAAGTAMSVLGRPLPVPPLIVPAGTDAKMKIGTPVLGLVAAQTVTVHVFGKYVNL